MLATMTKHRTFVRIILDLINDELKGIELDTEFESWYVETGDTVETKCVYVTFIFSVILKYSLEQFDESVN